MVTCEVSASRVLCQQLVIRSNIYHQQGRYISRHLCNYNAFSFIKQYFAVIIAKNWRQRCATEKTNCFWKCNWLFNATFVGFSKETFSSEHIIRNCQTQVYNHLLYTSVWEFHGPNIYQLEFQSYTNSQCVKTFTLGGQEKAQKLWIDFQDVKRNGPGQ